MDSQIHPPFRSMSTTSNISLNTSSSSITRVASAPISHAFNKQSSAQDHLFWQCSNLKMKLEAIEGMTPFMNLAFNLGEQCAEQQALALSQQIQESSKINEFRTSLSGFLIKLDSSNNSGINNSNNFNNVRSLINNNIFTFTAGVLPANISVDPATQLWKLFQQGAPLCLLFNDVTDFDFKISIVGSDDLRICKKSVYEFLIAVQTYLNIDDDMMFTISNVFSDSTQDLLKVIKVVNKLLDLKNSNSIQLNNISKVNSSSSSSVDLLANDDRSKVFKEIIETERKYVQDLELLNQYKEELIQQDLISNEQIHNLFPNLNEIIDFQRRFLNSLECNINVPTKYQRIGSIFIHAASGPFKAYEPWTIGQLSAIDFINKEANVLRKSSSLLDPGFELQSFILKPIQRLCKYPLLLKELIKASNDSVDQANSSFYNELLIANNAMKELANQVNEAQRRAENVEYLHKLNNRVSNWRGFNLRDQGELLYHGHIAVKDGDSEKEYVAYLFEKIIFFFIESDAKDAKDKEKKHRRDLLSSRKKSSSVGASTTSLLETLSGDKTSSLELKGRVYVLEIYNVSSSNIGGYFLIIAWSGKKESGTFILRYRTEEIRNQWENCLRNLKTNEMNIQIQKRLRDRDSHDSQITNDSYDGSGSYNNFSPTGINPPHDSISLRSNGSNHRHNSSSSTLSMMQQSRQRTRPSSGPARTASTSQEFNQSLIKIKLIYNKVEIPDLLIVSSDIQFNELYLKISGKIVNSEEITDDILVNKLKYYDEDGDFVVMDSNDDWNLVIDMLNEMDDNKNNNYNNSYNSNDINDKSFDLKIWVS